MSATPIDQLSILDLKLLQGIDQYKSISRAGAHLNLSPSKTSRMLKQVREILGDECFVVVKDKLVSSQYYDTIRPTIHKILGLSSDLATQSFDPATSNRVFHISCVMAELSHILGGVLPMMLERAPNVRLDLQKQEDEFLGIFTRRADFALVTEVDLPPDVHTMRLYKTDRVVLLRKNHPLAKLDRPLKMDDLAQYGRVTIRSGRTSAWSGPDQSIFPAERFMEHSIFDDATQYGLGSHGKLRSDCHLRLACRRDRHARLQPNGPGIARRLQRTQPLECLDLAGLHSS
jgi:DNA-binding transcriptional LysR family regulator